MQYAQKCVSAVVSVFAWLNSTKLIQNHPSLLPLLFQKNVQSGFSTSSEAEVSQHICMCLCCPEWCKELFVLMCPKDLWLTSTHLFITPPLSIFLFYSPSLSFQTSDTITLWLTVFIPSLCPWVLLIHPSNAVSPTLSSYLLLSPATFLFTLKCFKNCVKVFHSFSFLCLLQS